MLLDPVGGGPYRLTRSPSRSQRMQPPVVQPGVVRSYQTRTFGRAISAMGDHHFVVDHAVGQEGPGEQPGPVEFFLSGVSSCGVLMLEREARNRGIPVDWLEVTVKA